MVGETRRVFISYAHEDREWCELLVKHLGGLVHAERAELWADDKIIVGDEWDPTIKAELDAADIIVLIITHEFLGSKYCQTVELKSAMERHGRGSARIVPIIADHCDWQSLPIVALQCRPTDKKSRALKPLKDWRNKNKPMADIAREIRALVPRPTGVAEAGGVFYPPLPSLHNLPRRNSDMTGREGDIGALGVALAAGGTASICAVGGMGGIGKTSLAVEVAYRSGAAVFPDGILLVEMRGLEKPPRAPVEVMGEVLLAIEPGQRLPEDVAGHFQTFLRGRRMLLILDNAAGVEQVEPLQPPEPVAVCVTSRRQLDLRHGTLFDLDVLPREEALALLVKELRGRREDAVRDRVALDGLAELCGDLPIALTVAAGALRRNKALSVEKYCERLQTSRGEGLAEVADRLRPSLDLLAAEDAALLARLVLLSVMEAAFSAEAAAAVWAVSVEKAENDLGRLLEQSLLLEAAGGEQTDKRFRLHDLMREILLERLGEAEAGEARYRHAVFFRDYLAGAKETYEKGRVAEGLSLFDRERVHIEAAQAWAAQGWAGEGWAAQASSSGATETDKKAAELAADFPNAGIYLIALRLHSREQIAWLESAAAAARSLGDRKREGMALGNLGLAWADLGEMRKAIGLYEQHLVIAREIGDRRGEGNALGNLGNAWAALGETRKAIGLYEQWLVIAREIGDRRGEGNALGSLGLAWAALGETRKAIGLYEQALVISREIGDRRGEGAALGNLGNAWAALGETRKAIGLYEQRLVIAREIGDRRGEGAALGNLGNAWYVLGETRKAIGLYEQQVVITREIGDRRGENTALYNLADAEWDVGEKVSAKEHMALSLRIHREIEDPFTANVETWLRDRGIDPDTL